MNKDKEKYKRTALIVDALVLLTWETSTFGIIWLNYYNSEMAFSFFRKGNWLLFGLYFAILYVFSRIYKGLKIGSHKTTDIIAVSYTHLDVYKRQRLHRLIRIP